MMISISYVNTEIKLKNNTNIACIIGNIKKQISNLDS